MTTTSTERHWLGYAPAGEWSSGPLDIWQGGKYGDEDPFENEHVKALVDRGWRFEGPYVLEEQDA